MNENIAHGMTSLSTFALRAARKAATVAETAARTTQSQMSQAQRGLTHKIDYQMQGLDCPTAQQYLDGCDRLTRPIRISDATACKEPSIVVLGTLDTSAIFGGMATIFRVAAALAEHMGRPLVVAQTMGADNAHARDTFRALGLTVADGDVSSVDIRDRTNDVLPLHEDDIVVVSAWWDAVAVSKMGRNRKFVYLIQDYEPIFYSNSDDFVAAEASYLSRQFVPIFNTSELRKFFATKGYFDTSDSCFFEPAVELPSVSRSPRNGRVPKLFFYARPGVARNLFRTGLAAIDLALGNPEIANWEVHCAGSKDVPEVRFRNGTKLVRHGKMAPGDYFASLGTYDMCLSPMLAPHPNYPTLEFATAGVPVVTTSWETKTDLAHYSGLIRLAAPTPEALADRLVECARMTADEKAGGAAQGHIPTSWNETLTPAVAKLAEVLT